MNFSTGESWSKNQSIRFWWRCESRSATTVPGSGSSAEVCTLPSALWLPFYEATRWVIDWFCMWHATYTGRCGRSFGFANQQKYIIQITKHDDPYTDPDSHRNLIDCFLFQGLLPLPKISRISTHPSWIIPLTDQQTNKPRRKHILLGGGR